MSETMPPRNPALRKPVVVFLLATLVTLLWGCASPLIKLGYAAMRVGNTEIPKIMVFAGLRFFIAGLMTLGFFSLRRGRFLLPRKGNWGMLLLLGFIQTFLHYFTFFVGVANSSGVTSSILNGMGNLMAIFVACAITRQEKATLRKLLGCAFGVAGVVVMNLGGGRLSFSLLGEGMVMMTAIITGFDNCLSKADCQKEDPAAVTAWSLTLGGAMLLGLGLVLGGKPDLRDPAGPCIVLFLAAASAVAYTLWTALLDANPVSSVTIYGFLVPVFGVLLSAIILGEWKQATSPLTLIALALICAGIVIVSTKGKKNAASPEGETHE